jgi:hypothetical protein
VCYSLYSNILRTGEATCAINVNPYSVRPQRTLTVVNLVLRNDGKPGTVLANGRMLAGPKVPADMGFLGSCARWVTCRMLTRLAGFGEGGVPVWVACRDGCQS